MQPPAEHPGARSRGAIGTRRSYAHVPTLRQAQGWAGESGRDGRPMTATQGTRFGGGLLPLPVPAPEKPAKVAKWGGAKSLVLEIGRRMAGQ